MTTDKTCCAQGSHCVVETYRLDRYDNFYSDYSGNRSFVVETYRLDRYDNTSEPHQPSTLYVVETYRLDRYDNTKEVKYL